jgi:starch phosphorylase
MHDLINYLAPMGGGQVRMAWIACYASHSINGVAALHTEILKADTLKSWYELWPAKFSNKTNGVTPRRWLRATNTRLAALLTAKYGSDAWVKDLSVIRELDVMAEDKDLHSDLIDIKRDNKLRLAKYVKEWCGIDINPEAIFDIQIKRLHEYKRQLLNAFYILDLYFRLKSDPAMDIIPRVFFFGAKAAPGYVRAKSIIKFINEVARIVNNDPMIGDKIKVVFVPNYNVTKAEIMIPAADVSEQISLAGKEASGTGNMKFMMNGALTLGTYDGANVEIAEEVGDDNIYIFGVRVEDLPATLSYYNPRWQYENIPGLKRVIDSMTNGFLDDQNSGSFQDLVNGLLYGTG